MEDNKKKKKAVTIILLMVGLITILFGVTYAYWLLTRAQEDTNIIKSKCLSLDFGPGFDDGFVLVDALPIKDEEALLLTDNIKTFTVKNNCDYEITYEVGMFEPTWERDDFSGYGIGENEGISDFDYEELKTYIDGDITLADMLPFSSFRPEEDVEIYTTRTLKYDTLAPKGQPGDENEHDFRMWVDYYKSVYNEDRRVMGIRLFVRTGYEIQDNSIANMMKNNANSVEITDFNDSAGQNGIYVFTEEGEEPVYYYRGADVNNNLIFAGNCWKIMHTTPTGGVKILYSGHSCGSETPYINDSVAYSSEGNSVNNIGVGYMYGAFSDNYADTHANVNDSF